MKQWKIIYITLIFGTLLPMVSCGLMDAMVAGLSNTSRLEVNLELGGSFAGRRVIAVIFKRDLAGGSVHKTGVNLDSDGHASIPVMALPQGQYTVYVAVNDNSSDIFINNLENSSSDIYVGKKDFDIEEGKGKEMTLTGGDIQKSYMNWIYGSGLSGNQFLLCQFLRPGTLVAVGYNLQTFTATEGNSIHALAVTVRGVGPTGISGSPQYDAYFGSGGAGETWVGYDPGRKGGNPAALPPGAYDVACSMGDPGGIFFEEADLNYYKENLQIDNTGTLNQGGTVYDLVTDFTSAP